MAKITTALDNLADSLSGQDNPKGRTVSEAIDILKEALQSSGGGGGDGSEGGSQLEPVVFEWTVLSTDQDSQEPPAITCSESSWDVVRQKYSSGHKVIFRTTTDNEYFPNAIPDQELVYGNSIVNNGGEAMTVRGFVNKSYDVCLGHPPFTPSYGSRYGIPFILLVRTADTYIDDGQSTDELPSSLFDPIGSASFMILEMSGTSLIPPQQAATQDVASYIAIEFAVSQS